MLRVYEVAKRIKMLIEFNKIKKLIQSIALFLTLSYTNLYADAGHNYLCETEMFVAFPNGENPIRYDNEFFRFTWKKNDTIVFNDESLFKGAIAPIIYSSVELFDARLEFSTISYSDGAFNYSQTLYKTITIVQATCNNETTN